MENFSENKYCMSFPWGHGHTKFAAHIEDNRPWESKIFTAREGKYSGKRPKTLSSKIYFLLLHLEIDTSPPAVPPCERCHMAPLGGKWGNVAKDERLFGTTMPHQPWSPQHTSWKRGSKAMWTCWLPWDVWTTCTQRKDWSVMIHSVS